MKRRIRIVILLTILVALFSACGDDTAPAANSDATIVYITKSGTKYHREDCQYLSKSSIETTLEEAQSKGYAPCSKCNPPE